MSHDVRVGALLDELSAIEERLDPDNHRKAQLTADSITVALLLPLVIHLDWYARYPLLMFGLMIAALALNRIPPLLTRRRLRKEHDELFARYQEVLDLAEAHADPSSTDG